MVEDYVKQLKKQMESIKTYPVYKLAVEMDKIVDNVANML